MDEVLHAPSEHQDLVAWPFGGFVFFDEIGGGVVGDDRCFCLEALKALGEQPQ